MTTKELLQLFIQELYMILSNMEITKYDDELKRFINNFLFEYDLDAQNVFEIMTKNSQNISYYYSSIIGIFYQFGIGCEADKIKAFEIFSNNVKNKQLYFDQEKNEETAFYKKLNEIVSQYFYSLFLYKDIIIDRKYNYKLHIKNAKKGNSVSQYFIGNYYYCGIGIITRNYSKAVEWYSKSSERGNAEAMCALGRCYFFGCGSIAKDKEKAFELFLKSAERGCRWALYMVGSFYDYGYNILKDENKAFEWYLKAAKKGHTSSQYLVAKYSKNEEEEYYWKKKAAINDHVDAQYELAEYYLSKNRKKAFRWYLKLANENRIRATCLVAKCYRDGIGTERNLVEATKWFKRYEFHWKMSITLDDFLNGSNINEMSIRI
jgi:TPR repeat protein